MKLRVRACCPRAPTSSRARVWRAPAAVRVLQGEQRRMALLTTAAHCRRAVRLLKPTCFAASPRCFFAKRSRRAANTAAGLQRSAPRTTRAARGGRGRTANVSCFPPKVSALHVYTQPAYADQTLPPAIDTPTSLEHAHDPAADQLEQFKNGQRWGPASSGPWPTAASK